MSTATPKVPPPQHCTGGSCQNNKQNGCSPASSVGVHALLIHQQSYHNPCSYQQCKNPGSVLNDGHYNMGTALSVAVRDKLSVTGLLPGVVESIDNQVKRCLLQLNCCPNDLSKYVYLLDLKHYNETLFYRLLAERLFDLLPLVYTPTVGEGCLHHHEIYRAPHGLYITKDNKGNIPQLLNNWSLNHCDQTAIIVVSDGSRILGLGDLGANGMGIPVGKATLYIAAGGFHPSTALPVLLDTGTNNKGLVEHELYLGKRYPRLDNSEFYGLLDEFLMSVKKRWPRCLVQFEDFSNDHCFDILDKYSNKMLCFNDDIQGTGAVIAAGFLNAVKALEHHPSDLRVLFLGAGSAGIGVADQIGRALQHVYGMTREQCVKLFYMVDTKGLVYESRGDSLASFKVPYARKDIHKGSVDLTKLSSIIAQVKPHALIGLSGQHGQFTDEILKQMSELNKRPIVFPLSNPTKKAECTAEAAYRVSEGRVLFASGSPFPPVELSTGGTLQLSQGNNMYVFPGLGFGAWLGECSLVSNGMLTAATVCLAEQVTKEDLSRGLLYPPLSDVRDVSAKIAAATIQCAQKEGLSTTTLPLATGQSLLDFCKASMYKPDYVQSCL
eukprot:GHVS01058120.1.p1 GENE.GHVS01058120.1~~GHVS01058120.1.p1  ORF type:complete len:609 (-),score=47.91 GHVS01058120.1:171-1997(-)